MEKYTIKLNKRNKETGEKYFVIQEKTVKTPLERYEAKMKRYSENRNRKINALMEKNKKLEELYEIKEETINKKIKIVTTKPNPSKGAKTDIVFEWSPEAKAAKAALANQKITYTINFNVGDKSYSKTIRRQPTLKDISFAVKNNISKVKDIRYLKSATNEADKMNIQSENKKRRDSAKLLKLSKLDSREFSLWRKDLVSNSEEYGKANNYLKHAAEESAHETKIQKLIKAIREKKLARFKYRLEFRKFNSEHKPVVFVKNYSNKTLAYLHDSLTALSAKLVDKIEDFISINIYDNATDQLLRICTGWTASSKDYEIKLKELKNLYPDYYTAEAV